MSLPSTGLHSSGAAVRTVALLRRAGLSSQGRLTAALVGLSLLLTVGILLLPTWFPPSAYLLLGLAASFLLGLRGIVVLAVVIAVEVVLLWFVRTPTPTPGTVTVIGLGLLVMLVLARDRDRLGLQGAPGDLMLVDLRDRLYSHGRIPALPEGWHVDTALRSAHAQAFSGDFLVAARPEKGTLLEIALVDVSGKGQGAGVRSLLLSGAFGGLLGAMPRERFLATANQYLLAQDWDEGFATAVHVAVDLETGRYWMASAGHPPAIHLHAGSGRLETVNAPASPALGVVEGLRYPAVSGRLEPGDVLLLYTDGVVEVPGGDLELGIDRLMGAAERVLATRSGGAEDVMEAVQPGESDDRALVLVIRD